MITDVICEDPRWEDAGLEAVSETAAQAVFARLNLTGDWEVVIMGCDDARIAVLNADFREKDKATNVLSWPSEERSAQDAGGLPLAPEGPDPELGDIAISFDTCMREAQDAVELLDHLGLAKVAILGTSRGGIIVMGLAATLKERLLGVAMNDIGPSLDPKGLEAIMGYLGLKPRAKTLEEAAGARAHVMRDMFPNVPAARWLEEVSKFFNETADGLELTYDPKLRDAVEAASHTAIPDLWPWFEALNGLPTAILRGANSDLLMQESYDEMVRRLPDARGAVVADRAHVPFLDEPESIALLHAWIGDMQ